MSHTHETNKLNMSIEELCPRKSGEPEEAWRTRLEETLRAPLQELSKVFKPDDMDPEQVKEFNRTREKVLARLKKITSPGTK